MANEPKQEPWAVVGYVVDTSILADGDDGRREVVCSEEGSARLNAAQMTVGGGFRNVRLFRCQWIEIGEVASFNIAAEEERTAHLAVRFAQS